MLRHWRKITVTNREQNRLEVYCMDETTESNRGRGAFDTRLIRHERVADEPALQWLRGLFAVHAHREDPKAKTGAFRAFRRRRFRPDRT